VASNGDDRVRDLDKSEAAGLRGKPRQHLSIAVRESIRVHVSPVFGRFGKPRLQARLEWLPVF
jgi:hypothetical protein